MNKKQPRYWSPVKDGKLMPRTLHSLCTGKVLTHIEAPMIYFTKKEATLLNPGLEIREIKITII